MAIITLYQYTCRLLLHRDTYHTHIGYGLVAHKQRNMQ